MKSKLARTMAAVLSAATVFAALAFPVSAGNTAVVNDGGSNSLYVRDTTILGKKYAVYKTIKPYYRTLFDLSQDLEHSTTAVETIAVEWSRTYSSEKASSFSVAAHFEGGPEFIKAGVELAGGMEKTKGRTFEKTNSISITLSEKNPAGHYKYAALYDYHRVTYSPKSSGTSHVVGIPIGNAYIKAMYRRSSSGTWMKLP